MPASQPCPAHARTRRTPADTHYAPDGLSLPAWMVLVAILRLPKRPAIPGFFRQTPLNELSADNCLFGFLFEKLSILEPRRSFAIIVIPMGARARRRVKPSRPFPCPEAARHARQEPARTEYVHICQKSRRIGCVTPHCNLQRGITQPIHRLF